MINTDRTQVYNKAANRQEDYRASATNSNGSVWSTARDGQKRLRWNLQARRYCLSSCFLCGTNMVPRFRTRDHLRPQVLTEYQIEWCEHCEFGRVAGEFTPSDVAGFYASEYYTHFASVESDCRPVSLLDRLRVHLAWKAGHGVVLSPSEIKPSQSLTLCDVGCGGGKAMV